jgi:dTMP kinase
MEKKSGFLIAFEGIDGSGKSTLSKLVFRQLEALHVPVVLTKEPGGTPAGQKIRAIVHEHTLTPQAEFLLFAADRAEHIAQVIKPALQEGKIILSDRMADSSRAYQGYGREIDLDLIERVTQWVMQGITPDLIVYSKIDAITAFKRITQRNEAMTVFEREKTIFFERVIDGFEKIFATKDNVLTIDAQLPPAELAMQVFAEINKRFK